MRSDRCSRGLDTVCRTPRRVISCIPTFRPCPAAILIRREHGGSTRGKDGGRSRGEFRVGTQARTQHLIPRRTIRCRPGSSGKSASSQRANRAGRRGDSFAFGGRFLKSSKPPFTSAGADGMHGTTIRFLKDSSPVDDH